MTEPSYAVPVAVPLPRDDDINLAASAPPARFGGLGQKDNQAINCQAVESMVRLHLFPKLRFKI